MTANELADELGNILTFLEIEYADYEDDEILKQASTMLRQQQNKIEALKLRELTDEEIDKIIKQHDWYSKTWVDMVRSIESAILQKANEK
jgi:TRAP-type uncharacterized transport system substrate-binding protein